MYWPMVLLARSAAFSITERVSRSTPRMDQGVGALTFRDGLPALLGFSVGVVLKLLSVLPFWGGVVLKLLSVLPF